jgi:hypothetical protein
LLSCGSDSDLTSLAAKGTRCKGQKVCNVNHRERRGILTVRGIDTKCSWDGLPHTVPSSPAIAARLVFCSLDDDGGYNNDDDDADNNADYEKHLVNWSVGRS